MNRPPLANGSEKKRKKTAPGKAWLLLSAALPIFLMMPQAAAQRAGENAVESASDGFGSSVGNEQVGIYSVSDVRGFSPIRAGNRRFDGLYLDIQGNGLTRRLYSRSDVRVGLPAINYPFPAPSGIVDYSIRKPGDDQIISFVGGLSEHGGRYIEADAQLPIIAGSMGLAAGGAYSEERYSDGRDGFSKALALLPTLIFERGAATAFWSAAETGGDAPPIFVTSGANLPPIIKDNNFKGQDWARNLQESETYGALGRYAFTNNLSFRFGAFESKSTRESTFIDLFLDVQPDGTAENVMISEPVLPARWTSGEVRLSWETAGDRLAHAVHFSVRGRNKRLVSGGGGVANLGKARIGRLTPQPEPDFAFADTTTSEVEQLTAGISYLGRFDNILEYNLGVQKADYSQMVRRGDALPASTSDAPWLYNATLAVTPRNWLAIYGGYATGLEETDGPPSSAVNRDDAIPASKTKQFDAGLRFAFGNTRILAGVFQIERPYFSLDENDVYAPLGILRNRGLEFSVVSQPMDRLTFIAGAAFSDPEVRGEAVIARRAGSRPVRIPERKIRIDAQYELPILQNLTATFAGEHIGKIAASTAGLPELDGEQLFLEGFVTVDLGLRYRFALDETPVSARFVAGNIFDDRGYTPIGSNTFRLRNTRRFTFEIAADF